MIRVVAFLLLVVGVPLAAYVGIVLIRYSKLKQLVDGLEHPELWLPRSERRAHARKLLRREDDEYTQKIIERTMREMKGPT